MKDALIICTRNRSDHIDRWLYKLAMFTQCPSLIIIVDSNSSQQTFEIVKKHQTQSKLPIEYVHSQSGLPLQRNNGIDHLLNNFKGTLPEIVHFLDDDVSVQSDYFSTVNRLFDEFSNAIAVGGFDKNTDIKISTGIWRRLLLLGSRRTGVVLKSGICIPPLPQSRAEVVEWLPGLSQSFRFQIFSQVRFDSKIYFYGEDIDFYLRIYNLGSIICSNLLPVEHLHEPSDRDQLSKSIMYWDGSRWSLAHRNPHLISRWAVGFSTAMLLVGEIILGLTGRGKNHFNIAQGHIWFFKNILCGKEPEKIETLSAMSEN